MGVAGSHGLSEPEGFSETSAIKDISGIIMISVSFLCYGHWCLILNRAIGEELPKTLDTA